jgi:superfamily I DNA/RNA helicase/RecB family exonuclease
MASTFHSFAYGLIRKYAPADLYIAPLRLLSAPEQDVILRELLTDAPESVSWPDELRRAVGTRGFAREVHDVLARAREKGLDGEALRELGERAEEPAYAAAGLFLDQYLANLDAQGAVDYADLIRRAVIEAREHQLELRERFRHVFVDEYQDTDPGQVALLRAVAGDGGDLIAVGDPHQSIYAFRGAQVRGIFDFPDRFRHHDGRPADVVALGTTRRFGPRILDAAATVAARLPLSGSIPEAARAAFLHPESVAETAGAVEVHTYDTERAEAEHIADLLRRAHLEDGLPWHDMAVLVRSARSQIPALRRALSAAGVPVEVAGDDIPLVRDPAVAPLLDAFSAALQFDNDDPQSIGYLDARRCEELLTGPLGGMDAAGVRRLVRVARTRELAVAAEEGGAPGRSRELLRRIVLEPGFAAGLPVDESTAAAAVHDLLSATRAQLARGASAEEALWALWSGTSWPDRLRAAAESGGGAGRRAHRDLDALVALFDAAARSEEKRGHAGAETFVAELAAQEIPADTLAERGVRGSAVRLLTAHRSKGLEWPLVVLAHVQAERWPDLRRRASLLQADRIGDGELAPPASMRELLAEERRLFYVACTRARTRLVVTAVASPDDDGEQPSRFLSELGVEVTERKGRPARPLSMTGLVSDLRRTVTDPAVPEALRAAAARRLARLATERIGDRPLVPAADPASWWGTRGRSLATVPLRELDAPVKVSASTLKAVADCPAQWFFERDAGGSLPMHQAAGVGQLVHALAEHIANAEVEADIDVLMSQIAAVWGRLEFRTPWSSDRELGRVRRALVRFVDWHRANPRRLLGTEVAFTTEIEVLPGTRVRLHGYADRLEVDADGRVVVVDLKTGRNRPSNVSVTRDLQLALYQYAVDSGALADLHPDAVSGGAELLQIGAVDEGTPAVVQGQPAHTADGEERADLRQRIVALEAMLRTESFPATPGDHCRFCAFEAICPARSAGSVVDL